MKHLAILLSVAPTEGGKFQYSLSLLHGLCALDPAEYRISAISYDRTWSPYIPKQVNVKHFECQPMIAARLVRKVLLAIPHGLPVWREIAPMINSLHKLLHHLKPDLVFYPAVDSMAYETVFPGVVSIHDLMHRYERQFPEVTANGVFRERKRHYENICHYAKAILVDSEVGRNHVVESYDCGYDWIHVLPYVKPPYINNLKSSPKKPDRKIPDRFIFYPAQMWKHKNHSGIIKAMNYLGEKGLIVNAVFVGARKSGAVDIDALIDTCGLGGQVYLLGYVPGEQLVWLYRNAVALVMPTFFGPTNVPPLEAFALGCPVITSNIYAMPEQVGDAALLVDPRDYHDIAEKIELVWTNEEIRQKLIQNGRRKDLEWNQSHFNNRLREIVKTVIE